MATNLQVAGAVGRAALDARLDGAPEWLARRRTEAWEAYAALPMPSSQHDEDWRRTDIRGLVPEDYVSEAGPSAHGDALVEAMRQLRDQALPGAAFVVNTRRGVRACEGLDELTAQGVVVGSLEDAAARHPDLVRRGLDAVPADQKFTALWNALWRGGCFIHVPAGVSARVPLFAAHTAGGDHPAIFPATVAVLEAGATLTLVDAYASPAGDAPLLRAAGTALVLGADAQLDYSLLQRWGAGAWHLATHRAILGKNARLRMFGASLGSRLQKAYWEVLADGEGADAEIAGVAFATGDQHLDHQSLQRHGAPHTRTNLLLKVAVRDQARSVYSGLVEVVPDAQHSDGYVQNRNLILGSGARASGIPRLEIRADDVRCGHGATVGHIDAEQRFYLESRGVDPEEAQRVIVRGFMQDALDRCPQEGLRDLVAASLDAEIAGRSQAGVAAAEAVDA